MMSRRPLVEMKAIERPSGEKRGPVFMPTRSTTVRIAPPSSEATYTRASYAALKPLRGAAE